MWHHYVTCGFSGNSTDQESKTPSGPIDQKTTKPPASTDQGSMVGRSADQESVTASPDQKSTMPPVLTQPKTTKPPAPVNQKTTTPPAPKNDQENKTQNSSARYYDWNNQWYNPSPQEIHHRDPCQEYNPCQNGGRCVYSWSAEWRAHCECDTRYYTGEFCEHRVGHHGMSCIYLILD